VVVDGVGNYSSDVTEPGQLTDHVNPLARESESYYKFDGSRIETLKKVWLRPVRGFLSDEFYFMPGLGALYSRVSIYVFAHWNKCGEVMGLAPYGRPGAAKPLLEINGDEVDVPEWGADFDKPFLPEHERDWEASASMQHWKDIAWRVQDDAETLLLKRAIWLREATGAKNLCMAGGVALNCVANGRIAREAGFENIWIQPAAGDDGIAIGCAYYGYLALLKKQRSSIMKHAYLVLPTRIKMRTRPPITGAFVSKRSTRQARTYAATRQNCCPKATCLPGFRAARNSGRGRSAIAASWRTRGRPQ
jgi:carbamoyltransferase